MAARVTDRPSANPFVALADRPVRAAVLGALSIAFSAVLVRLSGASPATAAIFRCVYALPFLAVLAWSERRAYGPRPAAQVRLAWLAGIFFAIDLVVWHHTIEYVGAGLATVLGNTQVVIVALLAWWLLGERPSNRVLAAMPIVLLGVVLISGVIGSGAYGSNPGLGVVTGVVTGVSYAGFLMALRRGNADLRRPAGPLFDATWVAALAAVVMGLPLNEVNLIPSLPGHAYLAPDDFHLGVVPSGRIALSREEPIGGLRPSVAYLFRSLAEVCGVQALGVLLAGGGLAAHQRLSPAPARGPDQRDTHHPAGRIGPAGNPAGQRAPVGRAAVGCRHHPGRPDARHPASPPQRRPDRRARAGLTHRATHRAAAGPATTAQPDAP